MTPFERANERRRESGIAITCSAMQPDERNWVVYTLSRQKHRGGMMPVSEWIATYTPKANKTIDESNVVVATCDVEGQRIALGFVIVKSGVIEYIYVKRDGDFRGNGIGMLLIESCGLKEPVKVSRSNESWRRWCENTGLKWEEAR